MENHQIFRLQVYVVGRGGPTSFCLGDGGQEPPFPNTGAEKVMRPTKFKGKGNFHNSTSLGVTAPLLHTQQLTQT